MLPRWCSGSVPALWFPLCRGALVQLPNSWGLGNCTLLTWGRSSKSAATRRYFNKLDKWLIKALPSPAGGWACYSAEMVPWLKQSTSCSSAGNPSMICPVKVSCPEMSAGKWAVILLALQRWFCVYCLVSQQDWADDRQGWWEKLFSPEAHKARECSCHSSQLGCASSSDENQLLDCGLWIALKRHHKM